MKIKLEHIFVGLALLTFACFAKAQEVLEMFVSLEPTVQVVITNQPCKKFTVNDGVQLNYAYAINIETGERVEGCFTHLGDVIQVELVDDAGDVPEFYHYKINADNFQKRPNL